MKKTTATQQVVYSDTNFELTFEADTNLPEETIYMLMDEAADEWYAAEEDEDALCFPLPEWITASVAEHGCKMALVNMTSWYEPNYGF